MSTLNRYLLVQLVVAFVIILFVLTGLAWLTQVIRLLNLVIEKGRSLIEFLELTSLIIPSIAALVTPGSLLLAAIFVFNRINGDNELAVIHASGVSPLRILKPFLSVALVLTVLVLFVNAYVQPLGMRTFREKIIEVRTDLIATLLVEEGKFVSPESGLMVHIKRQSPAGELLGLMFEDARDPDQTIMYLAKKSRVISTASTVHLLLNDGTILRNRSGRSNVEVVNFDRYTLDLSEFAREPGTPYYRPPEMYMSELLNPDPNDPYVRTHPLKVQAEAHDRLSNPLYVVAMVFIAFAAMVRPRSTRRNRIVLVIVTLLIGSLVRVAGALVINLAAKNAALLPLAYLVPVSAITASLFIIMSQVAKGSGQSRADRAVAWSAQRDGVQARPT